MVLSGRRSPFLRWLLMNDARSPPSQTCRKMIRDAFFYRYADTTHLQHDLEGVLIVLILVGVEFDDVGMSELRLDEPGKSDPTV